jgi:hypothetical protein
MTAASGSRAEYNRRRLQAARDRRYVDHQLRDVAPVPSAMHGRLGTYTNQACRCEDCTAAARDYSRRSYKPRPRQPRPARPVKHGYVAYTTGCRCEVCRAAKAAYMRERRAQRAVDVTAGAPNQGGGSQ